MLRVNDIVINPASLPGENEDFLTEIMGPNVEPATLRVVLIVERDLATEEQGYTKRVQESVSPDAYVILEGGAKYRLHELTHA